jgi:16S rRNA (guanine1207-N2)-methyltransferase
VENVSQIVLRQAERLPRGPLTLLNPSPDDLFRELQASDRPVRLSCGSHGDYRRLRALGADVRFEAAPADADVSETVILVLPREKEKLAMLLHASAGMLAPTGRLWLTGPNRAGIKSAPRSLGRFFSRIMKLDSARHCTLFEASDPLDLRPFDLDDYETTWQHAYRGRTLELVSLPGVFAHGRLDRGTALLLEVLERVQPEGSVLDFASGCGVIGLCIKAASPESEMVFLDDSALAIEAVRRSLRRNGMQAACLASDGLSELQGRFDWIVSNPPFHRGVGNDLDVASRFFRDAGTFLSEKGKILVVFNRHLPYGGWLRESYKRVDCLAQSREFTVIEASEKK